MSRDFRHLSRQDWHTKEPYEPPLTEQLTLGTLQRIADAVEKMLSVMPVDGKSYAVLRKEIDCMEASELVLLKAIRTVRRRNTALKGVITKKNKRLAAMQNDESKCSRTKRNAAKKS